MTILSFDLLRKLREEHTEEISSGSEIVLKVNRYQLSEWLRITDVSSRAHDTVKALRNGVIDKAFGFTFDIKKSGKKVIVDLTKGDNG